MTSCRCDLVHDDFEALYEIARDPAVWEQDPVPELSQREVFRANIDDAIGDEGGLVAHERNGRVAGYSRFSQLFSGEDAVEIGWTFLDPAFWGGRYNADMKRIMLAHTFLTFPLVIFRVGEQNRRSRRALEKVGATARGWRQDIEAFGRVGARIGYELSRDKFIEVGDRQG